MIPLAQPPKKDEYSFDDWMYRMWKRISAVGGIAWSLVDKTGASLRDIPDRQYKDLQYIPTPPVLAFSDGEDGQDGMQGIQGIPGSNGTNGLNGAIGPTGNDGEDGDMGYILLQPINTGGGTGITIAQARAITSLRL
jgi:hypothetical protein